MYRIRKHNKSFKRIVPVLALLLIAVFSCQIYNKTVYTHSHKTVDGRIITHAHPFSKAADSTPFKSHQHSQIELFLLESLEIFFPGILGLVLFTLYTDFSKIHQSTPFIIDLYQCYPKHGRAPPISV